MSALPKGWTQEPLAKLGTWTGGGTPSTTNADFWTNGTIPWVSPKDMKQRRITTAQDSITEAAVRASTTNLIPENSVMLVTRSGILRHSLPVATNTQPVTLNQDMKALTPLEALLPDYLYYAFRRYERDILHGCCKGGTTVQSIEAPRLMAFEIPIAPLAEQRRIVGKVEELFSELAEGVANLKQARAQLAVYRQALLKHAFEGHLTAAWRTKHAPELESADNTITDDLPELPKGWLWQRLGSISVVSGGLTKNPKREILLRKMKYLRVANVHADRLDLVNVSEIGVTDDEAQRLVLEKGDLLIVEGNGSIDQIGRVAEWNGSIPNCGHQNHLIRARLHSDVLPRFVLRFLQSPLGRAAIVKVASSTTGLHTLSISKVGDLIIPVAPKTEQQQLLDTIEPAFDYIDALEADIDLNLQKAEALRQSILKKAFAGELVPQNPADEPAAALLARIRAEREAATAQPKAKQAGKRPAKLT